VATDAGETVAIDTTITPELRREGHAREAIRLIQEARKSDGLDVTDRIVLRWSARDQDLAAALTEHAALIAGEVLAVGFGPVEADAPGSVPDDAWEHVDEALGLRFWLRRAVLAEGGRFKAWMPHPRRMNNMAGTSTPYGAGMAGRWARITSHGSVPGAQRHQEARPGRAGTTWIWHPGWGLGLGWGGRGAGGDR
jgi:hypothetical protein